MYAVIESGGKQDRASPCDRVDVELLSGTETGKSVRFDRVLAVVGGDNGPHLGEALAGAAGTASFVGDGLGPKIRVFKKKKRSTYRRTTGHRQHLHRVRIDEIQLPSSR